MEATILRKIDTGPSMIEKQKWHLYSKRLLKDLEAKGTIRTAVEGCNLSLHAASQDYLRAECLRTFPAVTLPASQLLRREEVET